MEPILSLLALNLSGDFFNRRATPPIIAYRIYTSVYPIYPTAMRWVGDDREMNLWPFGYKGERSTG